MGVISRRVANEQTGLAAGSMWHVVVQVRKTSHRRSAKPGCEVWKPENELWEQAPAAINGESVRFWFSV
jgi:hypothetical protein